MGPFGNIRSRVEKMVPPGIVRLLRGAGRLAGDLGFTAYAVGGCVRDFLLGRETMDIDMVIEGNGLKFARAAAERFGARAVFHKRFLTAVLTFPDGFSLDVATARREYYPEPASLPVVEPASIGDDLVRRDFTVNALAIRLDARWFGDLLDVAGGLEDLKEGIIRVFHGRSMYDDPTRAFRAARFSGRYGFGIEKETGSLIRSAVAGGSVSLLSGERLLRELRLILDEDRPEAVLRLLATYGLLASIHPGLAFGGGTGRFFRGLRGHWRTMERKLRNEERPLKWGAGLVLLTRNMDTHSRGEMMERLSLPARCREWIEEGARLFQDTLPTFRPPAGKMKSYAYDVFTSYRHLESLIAGAAGSRGKVRRALLLYLTEWRHVKPLLTGDDLKRLGLSPGPAYQDVLGTLLEERLEGKVKTRRDEIRRVRQLTHWTRSDTSTNTPWTSTS